MPQQRSSSAFDDPTPSPTPIAYGGLEPVLRQAERCGLPAPAGERIRLPRSKNGTGAFSAAKPMSLVDGMVAGASMACTEGGTARRAVSSPGAAPSTFD